MAFIILRVKQIGTYLKKNNRDGAGLQKIEISNSFSIQI